MGIKTHMEQNLQVLNTKANKPSKYKRIFPTPYAELKRQAPAKFKGVPQQDLDGIYPGVSVKVVFYGEEDIWLTVESVPENDPEGTVYCKVTGNIKGNRDFQNNQRVSITKGEIARVYFHEDDDF